MHECDAAGMQTDASVWIRARRAILEVAFDRAAEIGQLAADLMVAAGEKFDFHKPISVSPADLLIIEFCKFGILSCSSRAAYI